MVNYNKEANYSEDMEDVDFLTDKLIDKGLTSEEYKELRFLRVLNGLGDK